MTVDRIAAAFGGPLLRRNDAGGTNGSGANGGSDGATDQSASAGGEPLRVFVTSTTYNGALGEDVASAIANANSECQLRAYAGNLGGTWVAWLTSSSRIDMHQLDPFGPWHLPRSGAIVVESIATLMDCQCLGTAILEDEMGPLGPSPEPANVWTGRTRRKRRAWASNR